jgi:hypothetical protein
MKLNPAAALVLVGWFLIVPPLDLRHQADTHAPMSKWRVSETYDSAKQCRDMLMGLSEHKPIEPTDFGLTTREVGQLGRCIETIDPRLTK